MTDIESVVASTKTRREMAELYAVLMHPQHSKPNWPELNRAIMDRWSLSGLKWIKARAWKFYEERESA